MDRKKKSCKKDLMNEFEIIFVQLKEKRERRFYLASDGVNGLVSVPQRSHSTLTITQRALVVGQYSRCE